jgi:hypothetical protein
VEDADSLGALARLKVLPARNLGADGAVPDAMISLMAPEWRVL